MSSNLKYKQVQNVTRRTWDTEAYEKRAKARATASDGGSNSKKKSAQEGSSIGVATTTWDNKEEESKEEFTPAVPGSAGPQLSGRAFLKARRGKVDVDSKIGSVEFVNPEAASTTSAKTTTDGVSVKDGVTKSGVGWHCKVCDCFLKDSHTYLDHINGRKHQRNLGFSMRVERSTKNQVASRLELLAKEKEEVEKKRSESLQKLLRDPAEEEEEEANHFASLVKAKDEEAKRRKEERKKLRKERKKRLKENSQDNKADDGEQVNGEEKAEEVEPGAIDPAMLEMMGFSGFGGGKKNR